MKKLTLNLRSIFAFIHDIFAVIFAWFAAYLFRFNFDIPAEHYSSGYKSLWTVLFLYGLAFLLSGFYRGTWRFVGLLDLKRIFITAIITSIVLSGFFLLLSPSSYIPKSILILHPILLILIMGGSRFIYRIFKEYAAYGSHNSSGSPVIIIGAEDATASLIKDIKKFRTWNAIGILDNNSQMHGREILGVKIYGDISLLAKMKDSFKIQNVIILMTESKYQERSEAISLANQLKLKVLIAPKLDDLIAGKLAISHIRPVDIEDLLGREPVDLDNSGIANLIKDKVVMVTGAGGSIGSELCRQIVKFKPNKIICFDISEYALYQLESEFDKLKINTETKYLIGDIKNKRSLDKILSFYKPALIFHAAAYKHVPMMEHNNVVEVLTNNAFGTYVLAKACQKAKVEKFILISTDKAVNPTNVMGASKRLAEMICQGIQKQSGTKFLIVRFGNVLGSSGSVIPKFREQIKMGGPITITHSKIMRYFMSISEAAQLVIQAALIGGRGEIFVLDMGKPIKIRDLAIKMVELSGFQKGEIAIKYTGLRPGEKLYEELLANDELYLTTSHKKIKIAKTKNVNRFLLSELLIWISSIHKYDESRIKKELIRWLKEYKPYLL
ncbi:polysaccharide biosynthesis protein [Candidatus Methylopumilus rimovensis]|uniref:polysaccharide biosynthesis protein n=1 Tax=Candidatus Methylopumilus rimovensis TaxID=2588535 RepID=UPI0011227BD0|nr:nucleoside-diphosphate sugar epimerase/dehydratase [Candidatus Methylopumilus rimovensis]QDD12073.1 polysaccharide biosynthesis protein [Candidatus Methylopumilus rimovensis]